MSPKCLLTAVSTQLLLKCVLPSLRIGTWHTIFKPVTGKGSWNFLETNLFETITCYSLVRHCTVPPHLGKQCALCRNWKKNLLKLERLLYSKYRKLRPKAV